MAYGSTKETIAIAKRLWDNPQELDLLIRNLQNMQEAKRVGVAYSHHDCDIQANTAALLANIQRAGE